MTNWNTFIYGLGAVYLLYYLANLAFDLFKSSPLVETNDHSLVISVADLEEAIDASADTQAPISNQNPSVELLSSGEISSSGGVLFEAFMEQAANDASLFTKQIPT